MDVLGILSDALRSAFGADAAIYALAAIGLNMHFGYTGLLNFGQVAFMLVGGYGAAITVAVFGGSLWLGIPIGIGCSVVLALVLGLPALRLRSDYLAIATIAAGEILRIFYRSSAAEPLTGGVFGLRQFANAFYALNPFPPGSYGVGDLAYSARDLWVIVVTWGLVALACLLVYRLIHSPWGRVIKSVREDEEAARALGKNVYGYKLQSLVIGGMLGGLAGVMTAINTQSVQPDSFNPVVTFFLYTILILGGAGRVAGPVLGAIIFWFLLTFTDALLRQLSGAGAIPSEVLDTAEIGAVRLAIVGLGLILLMIYRPAGILGNRKELMLDAR